MPVFCLLPWEERFKSIAILDEASLLATCAYIDLNPVAAGVAPTPEKSPHTSIQARLEPDHQDESPNQESTASLASSKPAVGSGRWLFPIQDCRDQNGNGLAGLLRDFTLTNYLQLLDWSSRLIRPGKVSLSAEVPDILTRLEIDAEGWEITLQKLIRSTKKIGCYFGSTARLNEVAAQRGAKYLKNVTGRDAALNSPANAG